jgi:hypothetical protein
LTLQYQVARRGFGSCAPVAGCDSMWLNSCQKAHGAGRQLTRQTAKKMTQSVSTFAW